MNKEQLNSLWLETDKNITESYIKLRNAYEQGVMTKPTYELQKNFIDGFYSGWRDLYEKCLLYSEYNENLRDFVKKNPFLNGEYLK